MVLIDSDNYRLYYLVTCTGTLNQSLDFITYFLMTHHALGNTRQADLMGPRDVISVSVPDIP